MGKRSKPLMAFDGKFRLIAMFRSYSYAAKTLKVSRQSIINCVGGKKIMSSGYYWREIDSQYVIESDDFGKLNMIDYDKGLGINHRVYITKKGKKEIILENELT